MGQLLAEVNLSNMLATRQRCGH